MLGRDALAFIDNADLEHRIGAVADRRQPLDAHHDRRFRLAVLDGVRDQVVQDLEDLVAVGDDPRQRHVARSGIDDQLPPIGLEPHRKRLRDIDE